MNRCAPQALASRLHFTGNLLSFIGNMATEYVLGKFESGSHYIEVDKEAIVNSTKSDNNRVVCRLNDEIEFHCAILPKKEGGHFIHIGSATCKKLKIKAGSVITATFKEDHSAYQFEMPEELLTVLETDPEAYTVFHSLSEGNQRSLIYLVTQVKSSDKRIERALKIASKIKDGLTSARTILK